MSFRDRQPIRLPPFKTLPALMMLFALASLSSQTVWAQNSLTEFQRVLRERAAFEQPDFVALEQGQTVVKLLPSQDKREVAVTGLVSVAVPADLFLQSFQENMSRQSNPAILEIGSFSSQPTLDDLKGLTLENREIEDLRACVVGDCQLKLSAVMIERFQKEVSWEKSDYQNQATQLLKRMLLDYVRDYQERGDAALIEYYDKAKAVRLADEQRALNASSSYIYDLLARFSQHSKSARQPKLTDIQNALVWSKMKFGLKPVISISHITIYKIESEPGPQILITSKQIYANHYFDSSLGLTAFINIPGSTKGSFLLYENRSRADGLEGMFGKLKRRIVEDRAVDGLRAVLENSKVSLNARVLRRTEPAPSVAGERKWKQWKIGGVRLVLGLFLITALVLFAMSTFTWKSAVNGRAHDLQ